MPSMTRSFRPSFVNMGSQFLLASLMVAGVACQGPRKEDPMGGNEQSLTDPNSFPEGQIAEQEQTGPSLSDLRNLAANREDLNRALTAMDKASEALDREPEFWELYGQTSLDFAASEEARGRTDALEIMYNDAEYAFRRLRELDPERANGLLGHIYSLRMGGDFDGAWTASKDAVSWSQRHDMPLDLAEEIGRAGLAVVIEAVQAGQPVPAAAEAAETHLEAAIQGGRQAAAVPLADLLAWQGRTEASREALIQALIADPSNDIAAGRLINQAPGEILSVAWLRIGRSHAENPLVQWRLGEALWAKYWVHRNQQDYLLAHETLNRAEDSFLNAMALEASYQSSCQDWLHLIRTARGWVFWMQNLIDDAASAFLTALEADPGRLEPEPTSESLRLGINSVEGYFFQEGRLDKIRAFHGRLFKTFQDNPDWTNNYAFACRDLGVLRAQQGKPDDATLLFKESWAAYSRTVELSPNDTRLVNDRALISVYYLDEHWDEAEQELHRAIQLGAQEQSQMPADVPEQERQNLDEAIGDAWENLAYLDVVRRKRPDRADEYLAQALKHYPFENRDGVQRVQKALLQLRSESAAEADQAEEK
jgi:tetratricopeptide (TPR) repeat protein